MGLFTGYVEIRNNRVIWSDGPSKKDEVVDLGKLEYVYLRIRKNALGDFHPELVFFDHHQHIIPVELTGFAGVYQALAQLPGFDSKAYSAHSTKKEAFKVQLWRKQKAANCLPAFDLEADEKLRAELATGFWVNLAPKEMVSWDMTSDTLSRKAFTYFQTNEFGLPEIRFKRSVQLGNLLLYDFRYYLPVNTRTDVPLDSFYSNLHLEGNGDRNYFKVKDLFNRLMGAPASFYEREDQMASTWVWNGLRFHLVYWYDSETFFESGHAFLSVQNLRKYPALMDPAEYEARMEISAKLLIPVELFIHSGFRESHFFKSTPGKIRMLLEKEGIPFIIWRDEPNGKLGFANPQHAMIVPVAELESLELQNIYPAKGSGGTYLSAIDIKGKSLKLIIGDCHALDPYLEILTQLSGLSVTERTPYHDA
jgi:hypothetical protein